MAVAESSKKTTPATGITGNIQTTAKKFTVQNEEVALRLIPAAAPAEVKRSSGSESASDIGTCRIIVAPNSEAVLKENLFIDSGGSGSEFISVCLLYERRLDIMSTLFMFRNFGCHMP